MIPPIFFDKVRFFDSRTSLTPTEREILNRKNYRDTKILGTILLAIAVLAVSFAIFVRYSTTCSEKGLELPTCPKCGKEHPASGNGAAGCVMILSAIPILLFCIVIFSYFVEKKRWSTIDRYIVTSRGIFHKINKRYISKKEKLHYKPCKRDPNCVYRFVPWESIENFVVKTEKIVIETDTVPEVLIIDMTLLKVRLPPFLNFLLEYVKNAAQRETLRKLKNKIATKIITYTNKGENESQVIVYIFLAVACVPLMLGAYATIVRSFSQNFALVISYFCAAFVIVAGAILLWTMRMQGKMSEQKCAEKIAEYERFLEMSSSEQGNSQTTDEFQSGEQSIILPRFCDFQQPPRKVDVSVRKRLSRFYIAFFCALLVIFLLFANLVLIVNAPNETRSGVYFFRFVPAGKGIITRTEPSESRRAPNGNPAPAGNEIVFVTYTNSAGKHVEAEDPVWYRDGAYKRGQEVDVLRYLGDEECVRIAAEAEFWGQLFELLFIIGFFFTVIPLGCIGVIIYFHIVSKKICRMLAELPVERGKLRYSSPSSDILRITITSGERQYKTLNCERQGLGLLRLSPLLFGVTVHFFLTNDESESSLQKKVLVFEDLPTDIQYDAENNRFFSEPKKTWLVPALVTTCVFLVAAIIVRIALLF
ncbi:MAG: hypothetical protein ACRC2T_16735 [Thermoguttaceae bacterium]